MFNIKEQLKKLPNKPGVYIMKNNAGEVIYVGKAINLSNRVKQYFQSSKNQTPKVRVMVSNISNFEYIITASELEALILECNLIKKYRPKYNVLLKDDKHYPYIKVTMNEDYPRILMVRKIDKDNAKYFGPYSSTFYVNDTIETLKKIFPVRTCRKNFPRDIGKGRPCLNYHIKQCLAPCQGGISKQDYQSMMKEICLFLSGKHQELIKELEDKMREYSKQQKFENAAILRDKISSIKHIEERQRVISTAMDDKDVIAFATNNLAAVQVFFIRGGKLLGHEKFILDGIEYASKEEILCQFLKQFYSTKDFVPKEVLLQHEIDEINIIERWLSEKKGSKVHITIPKKGEKHSLIDMAYKNALQVLETFEEKIKQDQEMLIELQRFLGLNEIPIRIEGYDISNIHGSMCVGSLVTFINGKAQKSQYRRYRVKSVRGIDDYQSMKEILYRRFSPTNNLATNPNLICIDGGKGHVNSALQVLSETGVNIPVCGIVKNEKHKTRGVIFNNKEYDLSKEPKLFKLFSKIQSEVHRFAITYHKNLREKQLKRSILDQIDGIGPKRKANLLKQFKNIDNIKKADINALCEVKGINRQAAEIIYYFFRKNS